MIEALREVIKRKHYPLERVANFGASAAAPRQARSRLKLLTRSVEVRIHIEVVTSGKRGRRRIATIERGAGRAADCLEQLKTVLPQTSDGLKTRVAELIAYLGRNRERLVDYGTRHRSGLPISTSMAESAVESVVGDRFKKNRKMRWTPKGANATAAGTKAGACRTLCDRRCRPCLCEATRARMLHKKNWPRRDEVKRLVERLQGIVAAEHAQEVGP